MNLIDLIILFIVIYKKNVKNLNKIGSNIFYLLIYCNVNKLLKGSSFSIIS